MRVSTDVGVFQRVFEFSRVFRLDIVCLWYFDWFWWFPITTRLAWWVLVLFRWFLVSFDGFCWFLVYFRDVFWFRPVQAVFQQVLLCFLPVWWYFGQFNLCFGGFSLFLTSLMIFRLVQCCCGLFGLFFGRFGDISACLFCFSTVSMVFFFIQFGGIAV